MIFFLKLFLVCLATNEWLKCGATTGYKVHFVSAICKCKDLLFKDNIILIFLLFEKDKNYQESYTAAAFKSTA